MMEKAPEGFRPDVDPGDLQRIERLVAFVDAAMGETQEAESHPLATLLGNWVEWNLKEVSKISDNLLLASHCPGFERVIRGLGSSTPTRWEATVRELQVLGELMQAGFKVRIVPEGRKRSHDLSADINGQVAHFEVTNLGMSIVMRRSLQEIGPGAWDMRDLKGVSVDLKIHKSLSSPHREEIKQRILDLMDQAREGKAGFKKYIAEEDVFEATVEKGEKSESGSMNVSGPDYDRNELGRLFYVIKDKASQLPKNEPGILVIFDSNLLTARFESHDYSGVVANIEEAVFEFPNLQGVLLIVEYHETGAAELSMDGGTWFAWRQKGPDWAVSDRVFIRNRYSASEPDKRILAAFGWAPTT